MRTPQKTKFRNMRYGAKFKNASLQEVWRCKVGVAVMSHSDIFAHNFRQKNSTLAEIFLEVQLNICTQHTYLSITEVMVKNNFENFWYKLIL